MTSLATQPAQDEFTRGVLAALGAVHFVMKDKMVATDTITVAYFKVLTGNTPDEFFAWRDSVAEEISKANILVPTKPVIDAIIYQ